MESRKLNDQSTTGTVTTRTMFGLYFILWWMQDTVLPFLKPIVAAIPIIREISEWIVPALLIFALVFAVSHMLQSIRYRDLFFYFTVVLVVLGTIMLVPKNAEYITQDLWRILGLAVPAYFVGVCFDYNELKKELYWGSLLSTLVMCAYQIYKIISGKEMEAEDMNAAYNVLPSILFLSYWAFEKKSVRHWIIPILGGILLFSYGTRGPILVMAIYLAWKLFEELLWKRKGVWRVLGTFVLVALLVLLFGTNAITDFATDMSDIFEDSGLSTRVFDAYTEGRFTESEGREEIAENVLKAISDNLVFGTGFYGDRVSSGTMEAGNYAHNLALELWCQFGIFAGTAIMIVILWLIVSALCRTEKTKGKDILIMLACLVFVKLMVTGSYATERYFYFMIGMAIRLRRDGMMFNIPKEIL